METQVIFQDLPCDIDAYTVAGMDENGESFYTIVLNARLSDERQREAYYHEMQHIMGDDFECVKVVGVNGVEKEARKSKYEFAV
ncbi:hypothetical protein ACPW7J_09680 [Ihubacter sp. rT4E-8]|uniref:hypothetical protein n=1 Tax=Ihubacter sp. rT4E-8 TaxID=3242369 RepID=UPI003CEE5928